MYVYNEGHFLYLNKFRFVKDSWCCLISDFRACQWKFHHRLALVFTLAFGNLQTSGHDSHIYEYIFLEADEPRFSRPLLFPYWGHIQQLMAYLSKNNLTLELTGIAYYLKIIKIYKSNFTLHTIGKLHKYPLKHFNSPLKVHLWMSDSSSFLSLCPFISTIYKILTPLTSLITSGPKRSCPTQ